MRNSIDIAQRAVVIAALALFGLGCESDAPSGGKLSRAGEAGAGAEPIPATTSGAPEGRPGHSSRQDEEELEGLRKRMAIRQHIPADIGECTMGTCPDGYVCRDPVSDPVCVRPCSRGCGPQQACMSNGECGDVTLSEHIAPPGLPLGVVNHCQWLMKDHPLCGVEAERTECANFVLCSSITFSCAAHMALDMAGLRSEPVVLRDSTGAIVSEVPPQSSASNVTLAAQGAFYLASVYQYILTRAGLEDEDWECNAEEAQLLATNLVEAFHLANEASDVGIENMLAVADSLYAEKSSPAEKASVAIGGELLSRASAVHHLVGGDIGLPGPTNTDDVYAWISFAQPHFALCTLPPLTPQAEAALRAFREAAVSPDDVYNINSDVDISTLVNGTLPEGSVRERLAEMWNAPELIDVTDRLGLRISDFEQAREYMAQELVAFSRSREGLLPALDLINGEQTTYDRYAGTGTLPPQRDPMYWVTVAQHQNYGTVAMPQFDNSLGYEMPSGFLALPVAMRDYGLAGFIDISTEALGDIVATIQASDFDDEVKAAATDPILLFLADGEKQRRGRLRYRHKKDDPNKVRVIADCFEAPSSGQPLLLVNGEDGLECAVHGNIESANCDLEGAYVIAELDQTATPVTNCTTAVATALLDVPAKGTRMYLVEPVNPALTLRQPGNYRALASLVTPDPSIPSAERYAPIVPDLAKRAADILAPSRKWCNRPLVSCAGEIFDARLPLEDELTDDGDPVESSWRHFLQLARQASDEADLLGEQVVGLQLDTLVREEADQIRQIQRAEQATDELQDLCGLDVDPTLVLRGLGGPEGAKDFNALRGPACEDDSDCMPTFGECQNGRCTKSCTEDSDCMGGTGDAPRICIAGVCGTDPFAFVHEGLENTSNGDLSNAQRLKDCLGEHELVDFVTAGNKPLCIWTDTNNGNIVCDGGDPGQCPIEAVNPATEECPDRFVLPPGKTKHIVTETLDYIDLNGTLTRGAAADMCNDVRRVRALAGADSEEEFEERRRLIQKITDSNIYDPAGVLPTVGRRFQWHADYGGYSHIIVGNNVRYTTGNPEQGPESDGWPCDPASRPDICAGGGTGLFCDSAVCTDPADRARINMRMMRAVTAARDMTIRDRFEATSGIWLPHYVDAGWMDWQDGNQWSRTVQSSGVVSVNNYHNAGHLDTWAHLYQCASGTCGPAWITRSSMGAAVPHDLTTTWPGDPKVYRFAIGPNGMLTRGFIPKVDGRNSSPPWDDQFLDPYNYFAQLTTNGTYAVGNQTQPNHAKLFHALHGRTDLRMWPLDAPERFYWSQRMDGNEPVIGNPTLIPVLTGAEVTRINPIVYVRDRDTLLDGMELLCEGGLTGQECGVMPQMGGSLNDLRFAEGFLRCMAGNIRQRIAYGLFARVPRIALDALRQESAQGAFPRLGGEMAQSITDVREGLVGLAGDAQSLAFELDGLAHDMETLRTSTAIEGIRKEIREVEFMSTVSSQITQCVASAAPSVGVGFSFNTGSVAVCANSIAQIHFASEIKDLEGEVSNLTVRQQLTDFQQQFEARSERMSNLGEALSQSAERLDGGLASLERLRNRGRRLLAKALFMDSDIMQAQTQVNAVALSRLNTTRIRYEEAQRNARRMAFFARRAIEQRLGVDLSTLNESLPLVDAPADWADSVCEKSGFNFPGHPETIEKFGSNYADAFIGDYVTKLENLIESYRMVNNFHEGTDTAVISLRDDISNSRAMCSLPVQNLLYHAGALDWRPGPNGDETGWEVTGCAVESVSGDPLPDCVGVNRLVAGDGTDTPILVEDSDIADVSGYRIQFGPVSGTCTAASCGFRASSALSQTVDLATGRYRLSWYGRGGMMPPAGVNPPADALQIRFDGESAWTTLMAEEDPDSSSEYWTRYFADFEVEEAQQITIGIRPEPFTDTGTSFASQAVIIAAPMLEEMTVEPEELPRQFANTTSIREQEAPLCEDTTGEQFRRQFWRRGCLQLCDDGFAAACTDTNARTHCYREYQFAISPRDIEAGKIVNSAGFARGNFNYRIESLGFNVVGTGVRNCEDSPTPSSCYAGGFVPFTLEHLGPYRVRNYEGHDVRVELFPGVIEHARALGAERYVTNPLSSADLQLIEPYYRRELRGRPLDGRFVLRIWEEEAVDFSAIQDIQLILNYRYWTRFE